MISRQDQAILSKVEAAHTSGEVCELSRIEWRRLQSVLNAQTEQATDYVPAVMRRAGLLAGVRVRVEHPKGYPTTVTPKARKKRRRH